MSYHMSRNPWPLENQLPEDEGTPASDEGEARERAKLLWIKYSIPGIHYV